MITAREPARFYGTVAVVVELLDQQVKLRVKNYSFQFYQYKQLLVYQHFDTLDEDDGAWPKCSLCEGYKWKFVPFRKPKSRGKYPSSIPIMHAAVTPVPDNLEHLAVRVTGLKRNTNYRVRVCARLRKKGYQKFLGVMSKVSRQRKTLHNFCRGDLVQVTEAEGKEWLSARCEGNLIEMTLRDEAGFDYHVRDVASGLQQCLDFSPDDTTLELPRPEFVSIEDIEVAHDGMRTPRKYVYKTKEYTTKVTVTKKKELDLLFYPLGWREAYSWSHVRHYRLKVHQLLSWRPGIQARVKGIYPGKAIHPTQRAQLVPEDMLKTYCERAKSSIEQCGSVIVPALVFVLENGTQLRFQHSKGMWFRLTHLKNRLRPQEITSSLAVMLVRGPKINTATKHDKMEMGILGKAQASFYEQHDFQIAYWLPSGKPGMLRTKSSLSWKEAPEPMQRWGALHFANGTTGLG